MVGLNRNIVRTIFIALAAFYFTYRIVWDVL
jgi:hypothetical protein